MTRSFFLSVRCLSLGIAIASLGAAPLVGQVPAPSRPAESSPALLTPDGHPDLQGIWSFATITPMERPNNLAGKEFFTPEEAAEFEQARTRNFDVRGATAESDVGGAYNDFWWDPGTKVIPTLRTSLVIDPPDGKIPPMTEAARARQAAQREANRGHEFDGPENRPLPERCLVLQGAGPPTTPTAYNNNMQIVQDRDYVALLVEMGHEVRIIPLVDRPRLPETVELWKGDSLGHWEGDTLVVETTNFNDVAHFRGNSPKMRLTERFRRADENTLVYQFTVDDPETFTRPWTAEIPVTKSEGLLYEYACHEGNYGLAGVLAGARAEEKAATEGKGSAQ